MANKALNKYLVGILQTLAVSAVLAFSTFAQTAAPVVVIQPEYRFTADAVARQVAAITAGKDNAARAAAIAAELRKLKARVSTEGFNTGGKPGTEITGTNVFAEVAAKDAKRVIMIGAHLDRVSKGAGAVDNASGAAVVIELVKAFAARPMKNTTLKAALWDAEERGLVGSKTWVKSRKEGELPAIYINFDVFGYGDMLWLWTSDIESEFANAFSAAAADARRSHSVGTDYPPSDHLSFNLPGVKSHSFSLLTAAEVASLQKLLGGHAEKDATMPDVLQIIHTDKDVVEKVNAAEVAAVLPLIESSIRVLDK